MPTATRVTAEKKAAFLDAYAELGTVKHGANAAGVDRVTVWRWQQSDPAFRAEMEARKEDCIETLEASLYQRGLAGDNTAAIFWLKGAKPDKYADKVRVEHSVKERIQRMAQRYGMSEEDVMREANDILKGAGAR